MSGVGFLNPAGLLALAAVAVLAALYLYERRRRVIPIAGLFLWKQLPAQPLERRRFRPDPLFLLQLALLLALIAGYVRPYFERAATDGKSAPLVVVLDVSASMGTREESATRFDLARRRVRALTDTLAGDDEIMLVAAAERPHVALRWTSDRTRLLARLEALTALDVPSRLGPAIELALGEARARPATRVVVLTDLPPEASGVPREELRLVDYVQIGRTDDNLAITSLHVEQAPFAPAGEATVTTVIRNFGRRTSHAALEARVGGELWASRELTVGARGSEHVLLALPPRAGELELTLFAPDALAADNRAAAWIAPGEPLDLLLVSDSRELAGAFGEIAAALAGSRVEVMSRARYAERLPTGRRAALFDGFVPESLPPAVNALYVAPPPGNPVCPSTRALEDAAVIDWEPEHPVLRGLAGLQALEVAHARQLTSPDWGTPVVFAGARQVAFPLLVAGEREHRRIACLAAELEAPLAAADKLPLLVLTLSTLRWLAEPYGGTATMLETGLPALAGDGPTTPVRGPWGAAGLTVSGHPPVLFAERAGIYRLGPPSGERIVIANFFDENESDIGRDGGGEWPAAASASAAAAAPERREIGWWLYLAAIALLGFEWAVWAERERRLAAETYAADDGGDT